MDLYELTGMSDLKDFEEFYATAVEKLGGPKAFENYIPFDVDTLTRSYAENRDFNTALTPIRLWDLATGIHAPVRQTTLPPVATGGGLWPLLTRHGVTGLAQSQAVCLLKTAAAMLVEARMTGTKDGKGG